MYYNSLNEFGIYSPPHYDEHCKLINEMVYSPPPTNKVHHLIQLEFQYHSNESRVTKTHQHAIHPQQIITSGPYHTILPYVFIKHDMFK